MNLEPIDTSTTAGKAVESAREYLGLLARKMRAEGKMRPGEPCKAFTGSLDTILDDGAAAIEMVLQIHADLAGRAE